MTPDPSTYSRQEVAAKLGVSVDTIDRRIQDGKIPRIKIGHAVRIPKAWLDDLLLTQTSVLLKPSEVAA